jgi:hypothetical protein
VMPVSGVQRSGWASPSRARLGPHAEPRAATVDVLAVACEECGAEAGATCVFDYPTPPSAVHVGRYAAAETTDE